MPGAEPYFQRGDSGVGCLCLHGFTASPHEVLWLAQAVAQDGHTVYAPRIAGHGTHPRDLARTRWWDWLASATDAYYVLSAQCDRVYVVGLSMGGALALMLSLRVPVAGVAALAAPVHLNLTPGQVRAVHLLARFNRFTDQTDRTAFAQHIADQQALRGEPVYGRVRYNQWSARGVEQLLLLIQHTHDLLPQVSAPLLLVYSAADPTVPVDNLEIVRQRVSSPDVSAHRLERSGHILTQDSEAETVFRLVRDFVNRGRG